MSYATPLAGGLMPLLLTPYSFSLYAVALPPEPATVLPFAISLRH